MWESTAKFSELHSGTVSRHISKRKFWANICTIINIPQSGKTKAGCELRSRSFLAADVETSPLQTRCWTMAPIGSDDWHRSLPHMNEASEGHAGRRPWGSSHDSAEVIGNSLGASTSGSVCWLKPVWRGFLGQGLTFGTECDLESSPDPHHVSQQSSETRSMFYFSAVIWSVTVSIHLSRTHDHS